MSEDLALRTLADGRLRLFHRTSAAGAAAIVVGGFEGAAGNIGGHPLGDVVWLSNVPLDQNEGTKGAVLLEVLLKLPASALDEYEVIEDEKPYREWAVPAELIRASGTVILADDDLDVGDQRFEGGAA